MFTDTTNTINIPLVFRKPDDQLYPQDNYPCAEYWFTENIKDHEIKSDRIYLRITWTAFYKTCSYGEDKAKLSILQTFLNSLDTTKKYFTICQWDNGIINDISHLDIKVFSMAGGRKDYGLPLICQPHKIKFNNPRDIFCSFVGRITNPIRQKIVDAYSGKQGYYVSTNNHSLPDYCRILSRSVFSLCCRGYEANSFRIQESIEYGALPVWISDYFLPIHDLNFEDFGYLVENKDINKLDDFLRSRPKEEIEYKQSLLPKIFEKYFLFSSNKKLILENI